MQKPAWQANSLSLLLKGFLSTPLHSLLLPKGTFHPSTLLLRFPGSGWDRMAFSPKFLLLVSHTAKTSWGHCLAAFSSCLSFYLCLCISNLLGAMGKMLILITLCNYSEVAGVNARVQHSSNQNLALCCLNIFGFFFSPPRKANLHGLNSNTTVRIIFRQCFKISYGVRVTNMTTWEQFPGLSGSDAGLQFYGPHLALCSLEECWVTIFIPTS